MTINFTQAIQLVKSFEGCRLKAYQDSVGVWTCGYGTTGIDVGPNTVFTQEEADNRLASRIGILGPQIQSLVNRDLAPEQIAALISFAYNLGLSALKGSTLLKVINGQPGDVATEWMKWDHAGGKVLPGLSARRKAELALFQSNTTSSSVLPDGPSDDDVNAALQSVE